MRRLVVTGTGTEIGKTIVTAAVAALAASRGERVAVVKPAQTGIGAGEESDVETVARLSGISDVHELARYPEPLAPATAARRAGLIPVAAASMVTDILGLDGRDLVVVEGAGGLLVRLDADGATIATVAAGISADVLVVTAPGLGTLNATALTCDAIRAHGLRCAGVVVGAWPADPDLAARTNLADLPAYADAPLLGALPAGISRLPPGRFLAVARDALAPDLGGCWRAPA